MAARRLAPVWLGLAAMWCGFGVTGFATPPDGHGGINPPTPHGLVDTIFRIKKSAFSKGETLAPPPPNEPLGARRNQLEYIRLLVIPVCFDQCPSGLSPERLRESFFQPLLQRSGGNRASVADYFRAASCGSVKEVRGAVTEWLQLEGDPASYFPDGEHADRNFLEEVFKATDAKVNYAEFDDDRIEKQKGSKNDGFVDIVMVVVEGAPAVAYRFKMTLLGPMTPWGSEDDPLVVTPGTDPKAEKVKIDDFIILPAERLREGRIGVACHEIMHFLGLPDCYNRHSATRGGLGQWCLMSLGCSEMEKASDVFEVGASARMPSLLNAWARDFLGWGVKRAPNGNGVVRLGPRTRGDYTVIPAPGSPAAADELCYIEYHSPPTATQPWGKGILPDRAGFLVWHVDAKVGHDVEDPYNVWPSADVDNGQNDAPFDPAAAFPRPLIRLIQADGKLELENGRHDGKSQFNDPDDLFTGAALKFDQPDGGFTWYDGQSTAFHLVFNAPQQSVTLLAAASPAPGAPSAPAVPGVPVAPRTAPAPVAAPMRRSVPLPPAAPRAGSRFGASSPLPTGTAGSSLPPAFSSGDTNGLVQPKAPGPVLFTTPDAPAGVPKAPDSSAITIMPAPALPAGGSKAPAGGLPKSFVTGSALNFPEEVPVMQPMVTEASLVRMQGVLEDLKEKVSPGTEVAHEDTVSLTKEIARHGGQNSAFTRDLEKVFSLVGTKNSVGAPGSLKQLEEVSYGVVENAVSVLEPTQRAALIKAWEDARTSFATKADPASTFFEKYMRSDESARLARAVVSPDGKAIMKLSKSPLALPLVVATPEGDTKERLWDIFSLTGVARPEVALEIDRERAKLEGTGPSKVFLKYVAKVGSRKIPLDSQEQWAVVSYSSDGKSLENVEFNRPIDVKELPAPVEPALNSEQVIARVRERLGAIAPPAEKMKATLELIPDPARKGEGRWVPAYRVDLPLPTGGNDTLYVDPQSARGLD